MRVSVVVAVLATCGSLVSFPAAAGLYRCKVDGQLVFSDTRCHSTSSAAAAAPPAADAAPPAPAEAVPSPAAAPPEAVAAAPEPEAGVIEPAQPEAPAVVEHAPTQTIQLLDGKITLRLLETFRYLKPDAARQVIVDVWGNPPEQAAGVLGMILPVGVDPAAEDGWGAVITYSDDGHVSDEDADSIDYTQLLKDMQEAAEAETDARHEAGYPAITIAGWAEPPHYRRSDHRLYWAKDLLVEGDDVHTLNYAVRVLGRTGVLEINAVANTGQTAEIKRRMEQIVDFAEFNEGERYADYKAGDHTAAYGLAALVAGGVAAKKGMLAGVLLLIAKKLKILSLLLAKSWKLLAAGSVAIGAWLAKRKGGSS